MKANPIYHEFRHKNKHQNSLCDEFVFVRKTSRISTKPIVPLMAGETNADPNYFTDLRINGFTERYLTVVEYVVSGSGYITCNGITRRVSRGDVYILHPTFNGNYGADKTDPFVKKWCNIGGRVLPALMKAYDMNEQVNIFRNCPWAEKYFDELHAILSDYDENDSAVADLKLTHVLVDLLEALSRKSSEKAAAERQIDVESIAAYIDGNIAVSKITVEALSRMFYVNKRTLSRMFEKTYGMSPIKFITVKKIECAKKLLADGYGVEEVSQILFFSSAEYFRKVFVSVCGVSPQRYKKTTIKKE